MTESSGIDRRTKAYKDLISAMPKDESFIRETIDGIEYNYLPEPRCRVCTAGETRKQLKNGQTVQELVDTLLLYPKSIAEVYRAISPLMEEWPTKAKITYKSIRTHQLKHLAWDKLGYRMMVERWATTKGIPVMDAAGRMVLTEEAWLEATAHIGWQKLMEGTLEPSWGETQKAFERMNDIQTQAEGEFSVAELLSQLDNIISAIRETVPAELWPKVLAKLDERKALPRGVPTTVVTSEYEEGDLLEDIIAEQERFIEEEETV